MGDNNEKIEDLKHQFVEKIADNMNSFGVSPTVGRVLGIIYMQQKPMTLDELSEHTGMSKTRMGQVIREMIDKNIAEQVFQRGMRKGLYQVEQDYYQTFISLFTSNWGIAISKSKHFEQKLNKKINELQTQHDLSEEEEKIVDEILLEVKEWLDYYDWIRRLINFFDSGEIFEHVPKKPKQE